MKVTFIQLTTVMMDQDMYIKVVDLVVEGEDIVVTIIEKILVGITMMLVGTCNDCANYRGQQPSSCDSMKRVQLWLKKLSSSAVSLHLGWMAVEAVAEGERQCEGATVVSMKEQGSVRKAAGYLETENLNTLEDLENLPQRKQFFIIRKIIAA